MTRGYALPKVVPGAVSSAFFTAASAASKPILECVPSQNGLFTDPPQRHSEKATLPVKSYWLPSASTSSIAPSGASTRYGPFLRQVILTCAMHLLRFFRRRAPSFPL